VELPLFRGFAACTDSVGKAWVSELIPSHLLGTARGLCPGACQLAGHGSRRTPRWPAGVPGRWYPGSARGPTDLAAPVGWC